jgi:hypothetical protein
MAELTVEVTGVGDNSLLGFISTANEKIRWTAGWSHTVPVAFSWSREDVMVVLLSLYRVWTKFDMVWATGKSFLKQV